MKILYGTTYFEKPDASQIYQSAKKSLHNPSDKHDFLYAMDTDERNMIIQGMDALNNTISWEFTSETAIHLKKITELNKTLQLPANHIITYDEFKQIPVHSITKHSLIKYEAWLKQVGRDILMDEFKKN